MVVTHDLAYRGKRQRVGSPIFTKTGRLNFFIGYCPDCNGKCSVDLVEAKILMRMFGSSQKRPIKRIMTRIVRKYAADY